MAFGRYHVAVVGQVRVNSDRRRLRPKVLGSGR